MDERLGWIDGFVGSIRGYVYVRERDSLLILMPNQAYKLNPSALHILKRAIDGETIAGILEARRPGLSADEQATGEVHEFFCDLRSLVMGCLGEGRERKAVEVAPFTRPHNTLPVLSEIAVTYRCNLSCRFCYAGCNCRRVGGHGDPPLRNANNRGDANARIDNDDRDNGNDRRGRSPCQPNGEMTNEQVKRVLDVIRHEAEVPSVSWTGGEPTLRDDLVELTAHAATIGMRVNLITNGTNLTSRLVGDLKNAGLRSAQVSLEGPDIEIHDRLTGVAGSFERTIEGVKLLQEAGLHVHTNTTINRLNAPHLLGIVDLTRELGMKRLSMNLVIPCGSAVDGEMFVSYTEAAGLVEQVRRGARKAGVEFMWYSPTPYCIYNPVAARLGGKSCAACDGLLSVAPNGDVLPCSSLPRSVGNLLKQPFEKVWNSRKAVYWRNKRYAHRVCRRCSDFDLCSGACPIYWKAAGYGELMSVRRNAA